MKNDRFYSSLAEQLSRRASRAVLGKLGPVSQPLRDFLSERLERFAGSEGSFLADPVFEATFSWETAKPTMAELAGNLLAPELVRAMDAAPGELRFGKEYQPFIHQLEAWKTLRAEQVCSAVVSSGTGSGKTECFIVPILDDLVREAEAKGRLVGTRALFLYPLNALINSQRDRLRAWTEPLGGDVRYCLYNGNTPHRPVPEAEQKKSPSEVLSRDTLRKSPAPILVTNSTMLEYMLVRREDAPILEQSQGKLRWIVLDEAHTYVGSQAAELALLLRRVLHAFGVDSKQVRFVATSATIGKAGDAKTREQLQRYLADIAGVPTSQVAVIEGRRSIPELPAKLQRMEEPLPPLDLLSSLDAAERYDRLVACTAARSARKLLAEKPSKLSDVALALHGTERGEDGRREALAFLDAARQAHKDDPFLPLRGHFFHRTQSGLWACVDPECSERNGTPLNDATWPFGTIWFERRKNCKCGSLVFELVLCKGCGADYLVAEEVPEGEKGRRLLPHLIDAAADEMERNDDDEDDEEGTALAKYRGIRLFGAHGEKRVKDKVRFDPRTGIVDSGDRAISPTIHLPLPMENVLVCGRCGQREKTPGDLFLPARGGGPFFLQVAMPTLLEHAPPADTKQDVPFGGRRAITFSDSRQGTASFALRSEVDAERDYVRSFIYHQLSLTQTPDPAELEGARKKVTDLEHLIASTPQAPILISMLEEARVKLSALENPPTPRLTWQEMVEHLTNAKGIKRWLLPEWRERVRGSNARELADFVLYREFSRRPKRANSLETLGFVRVDYAGLERVMSEPLAWKQAGLSLDEWRAFLKLGLDFVVRSRSAITIPESYIQWLGIPFRPRNLLAYDQEVKHKNVPRWSLPGPTGPLPRMAQILLGILGHDRNTPEVRGIARELLMEAWSRIAALLDQSDDGYRLDPRKQLVFSRIERGWRCPITRRMLDTSIRNVTPYQTTHLDPAESKTEPVLMPKLAYPFGRDPAKYIDVKPEAIEAWLQKDVRIAELRRLGLWTEFSDRIARGSDLFVVREHSAQLSGSQLRKVEAEFKEGTVNLLSCSTTMEMGVDIGGLSVVGMNNAPPGPANFLQRAGRAGRRKETAAVTLTMCKAVPHGDAVFRNPLWPFETPIHVPQVSLDSERIVSRHLHSLLLTRFLAEAKEELVGLTAGWFFGANATDTYPARLFAAWLREIDKRLGNEWIEKGTRQLLASTCIQGSETAPLLQAAASRIEEITDEWRAEWDGLVVEQAAAGGPIVDPKQATAAQLSIQRQMDRMSGEYLLGELSGRGYLPAYGFPTGVVPFVNTTAAELKRMREEREARKQQQSDGISETRDATAGWKHGYPSRQVQVAIREYAPGSQVTVDRRVYNSRGVTLNWRIPATDTAVRELQALRYAHRCQECGVVHVTPRSLGRCPSCDTQLRTPRHYLQPAGFAVDITENVGNDATQPIYIRPERPWISVDGAKWAPLARPEAGRYRVSSEGHIFHKSGGLHGKGYAVCLHCGRAASETDEKGTADNLPTELRNHYPLRGGRERTADKRCTGNERQWAIQRNLWLGAGEITDVFELQLHGLETGSPIRSKEALASVAVALRQALAESIGVDEREIGWTVQTARNASGNTGRSIVLYDTAAGGAGYVGLAGSKLPELLRKAREILDCDRQCDKACHGCLLTFDTQHEIDLLDRKHGLAILTEAWLDALRLPDDLRAFGESSRLEWEPLLTAIRRESRRSPSSEITLFLAGDATQWDPLDWAPRGLLLRIAAEKGKARLVTTKSHLDALPSTIANDLASFLETAREIDLIAVEGNEPVPGMPGIIAELELGERRLAWSTTHPASRIPAGEWAEIDEKERHVFGEHVGPAVEGKPVDPSSLRRPPPGTWKELSIGNETDGPINGWGKRVWKRLLSEAPQLAARLESGKPLAEVLFADRYLKSPLQLRLLREFLGFLADKKALQQKTKLRVHTMVFNSGMNRRHPSTWIDDWDNSYQRDAVLKALLASLPAEPTLKTELKRDTEHARTLSLRWSDGAMWKLGLDEGVGFVSIVSQPKSSGQPHNFRLPHEEQAAVLLQQGFSVRRLGPSARFWLGALEE